VKSSTQPCFNADDSDANHIHWRSELRQKRTRLSNRSKTPSASTTTIALKHARSNVVTASIDRMDFLAPAYIGYLLRLIVSINYVHTTSMEIGVRVEAENPLTGQIRRIGTCYLACGALNKNGRPVAVPPLVPETADEKRGWSEAKIRRQRRLQLIGMKTTRSPPGRVVKSSRIQRAAT
jgi:acyl-CoA hydrolase